MVDKSSRKKDDVAIIATSNNNAPSKDGISSTLKKIPNKILDNKLPHEYEFLLQAHNNGMSGRLKRKFPKWNLTFEWKIINIWKIPIFLPTVSLKKDEGSIDWQPKTIKDLTG